MMRAAAAIVLLLLSGFLFLDAPFAESLSDALHRNLAALQKTTPGSAQERALQKTIIELVRKMKNQPLLTDEVERHMARGEGFVESAKSKGSFERAAREFRAVTRLAPWVAQAYYNLGVVQEKAGQYDAAMDSLRMYLLAAPNAPDARKVKRLIYKIEARKEEAREQAADRRRQEQARLEAERERRRQREREQRQLKKERRVARFKRLEGTWCLKVGGGCKYRMRVKGNRFELKAVDFRNYSGIRLGNYHVYKGRMDSSGRITGTYSYGSSRSHRCGGRPLLYTVRMEGSLSGAGTRLFFRYTQPGGLSFRGCRATRSDETPPINRRFLFTRP